MLASPEITDRIKPSDQPPQQGPRKGTVRRPVRHREGIFQRDNYFIDTAADAAFQSGARKRSGLKLALWTWMSAFIDTLVLISMSCFCTVIFSILMKTPAREVLHVLSIEPSVTRLFLISFLFSAWSYLIMMRVFMGASLGEWSCQLRLGQPTQRIRANYGFYVMARTTLVLATGVVTFPLLSLLLKRDVAGELSGIKIYSLT